VLAGPAPASRSVRLDAAGAMTAAAGLFLLTFGLSSAQRSGWTDPATLVALAAGLGSTVAFLRLEARAADPLLPLHIPADRTRAGAYLAIALNSFGLFATFLFLTFYLQRVLGYSPIGAGLAFLPLALVIIATATTATGHVLPRVGARPLLTIGPALGAAGMIWLTQLGPASSYAAHILPALILVGRAAGCTVSPAMSVATSGVAGRDAGVASAVVNTSQQIGGALGLAVLSAVAGAAAGISAYTTVFAVTAAVYATAVIASGTLIRGAREPAH
jgi:predicted MFS family arabinose efflux permease